MKSCMHFCKHLLRVLLIACMGIVAKSDDPPESSTIRLEDRANGILPQGPWLKEPKLNDGKPEKSDNIGTYWFIIEHEMAWAEAVLACEEHNAILAVLPNQQEVDGILSALKHIEATADVIEDPKNFDDLEVIEFGVSRRYWIGLTDHLVEGKWMWIGIGKPLIYDWWYPGQPSHNDPGTTTPGEHCGSLWNPGYYEGDNHTFNDAPCTDKYFPICETRPLETLLAMFPDDDDDDPNPQFKQEADDD